VKPTDKIALSTLMAEIQARGMELPDEIKELVVPTRRSMVWPVNEHGYFTSYAGEVFEANERQAPFIHSLSRFAALFSGRGAGKSASGSQKALGKISQGLCGAVMNPDFENFKISTWPEFKKWIPWQHVVAPHQHRKNDDWIPNQPFTLTFNNGAWVICKGLKDEDSARGPNLNWLWYDEACRDKTGGAWKIAVPSVRIGKDPQVWVTTTPAGKAHWTYEFFIKKNVQQGALDAFEDLSPDKPLIETFFTSVVDNKNHVDPMYYAQLMAIYSEGWLFEQEVNGLFVDQEGALGNRSWFDGKVVPTRPENAKNRIRYWDLAASEKKLARGKKITDPDESVGTLMSYILPDKIPIKYVEDQVSGFWEWSDIKIAIRDTALKDGAYVKIYVEEEPGSGGINQVKAIQDYIKEELPGWVVEAHNPRSIGDKVMRSQIWFAEAKAGQIYLVDGAWVEPFLTQLGGFPILPHDDKVDSLSGARHCLLPVKRWKDVPFLVL